MKRRLLNLLTLLSLLLCVAVVVVWVRSQFVRDRIVWATVQEQPSGVDWFNIFTYRMAVEVMWDREVLNRDDPRRIDPGAPPRLRWQRLPPVALPRPQGPALPWNRLGIVYERTSDADARVTLEHARLAAPYSAILLISLVLPAWRGISKLRLAGRWSGRGFDVSKTAAIHGLLIGLLLVSLGGGCGRQGHHDPPPPRPVERTAASATAPQTQPGYDAIEVRPVSIRDVDEMAERLLATTVQLSDGGTYVPAYIDEDARLALLWTGVRMKWEEVPFRGPISGLGVVPVEELADLELEHIRPPVRYLKTASGVVLVGHYEPRNRVFYHWRGVTLPGGDGRAGADADAAVTAETLAFPPTVVTIDPPADAPEANLMPEGEHQ